MAKPKLFKLLETFNKEDWLNAKRYVISQNRSDSELPALYITLWESKSVLLSFDSIDEVWTLNFAHHNRKSFMNLMSRLYSDLIIWIGIDALQKTQWESETWIVKGLNDRGLYHEANKHFESINNSINRTLEADTDKARISAKLSHFHIYTDNPYKYTNDGKIYSELIQSTIESFLDQIKLYAIELSNIARLKKYNFTQELSLLSCFDELNIATQNNSDLNTLTEIVSDSNTENYFPLYDKLLSGHFRPQSELHTLMTLYLIYKGLTLNVNQSDDKSYLVDLYSYALGTEVLMSQGKIPIQRFHNMITTLSSYNKYETIDIFIKRWAPLVNTAHPESTTNVAHAINCFSHERYDAIIEYTRDVSYEAITTKARALCLEIISLYHDRAEYLNECLRQIANFKRFLKRNKSKLSARSHLGMTNQLIIVEKLIKLDRNANIDLDLSELGYVFHKNWSIREIKKRQPK